MKTNLSLVFLLLLFISCTKQDSSVLSESEKEMISQEVKSVVHSIIAGCEAMNVDTVLGYFSDSPEYRMLGLDGSLSDSEAFIKSMKDGFSALSDFKIYTAQEETQVLNKNLVLYIWVYKATQALKTGEQISFEKIGTTFIFKKINNNWKIVHFHESGLMPVPVNPTVN